MNPLSVRLLTVGDVLDSCAMSRSGLYDAMNPHSERYDPDLPRPIKCGRRTYFVEAEVFAWLRRKIERYRNEHP